MIFPQTKTKYTPGRRRVYPCGATTRSQHQQCRGQPPPQGFSPRSDDCWRCLPKRPLIPWPIPSFLELFWSGKKIFYIAVVWI
jgi:hypothetical protein